MLAVPSARAGTVPTIGSAPHHTPEGRIPLRPCRRSQSFSPSFVRVNTRGVDFPHVCVGDYSRAPPPPRLCTPTQEGSTSFVSASTITAVLPLVCARHGTWGRLPSCPRRRSQPPPPRLCTSTHDGSTSLTSASMITAAPPPCLCTSTHEGSTFRVHVGMQTALDGVARLTNFSCDQVDLDIL